MEKDGVFSKENTLEAKGVAIVFMLIHHLFAYPNRITQGEFISLLWYRNVSLVSVLARFGNICIAMYIFLSGIGAYHKYKSKNKYGLKESLKVILRFLIRYWLVFLLFVPVGFVFFDVSFDVRTFFENFFCLRFTYNKEWWFVSLYIELMLIFPLYRKFIDRYPKEGFFLSCFVAIIGLVVKQTHCIAFLKREFGMGILYTELMYELEGLFLWQFMFLIGYLCAKYKWYLQITQQFKKLSLDKGVIYLGITMFLIILRSFLKIDKILDFVIVPVFILASVRFIEVIKLKSIFCFLGKHSINLWLIHTFLCYNYFQNIIYVPKYAGLILIWLLILCLLLSTIINICLDQMKTFYKNRVRRCFHGKIISNKQR